MNTYLDGPAGNAERIMTERQGTVAGWFITAPGQAPFWDKYILAIVHLREEEGLPTPHKVIDSMTHEVVLHALNPELDPQPQDPTTWQHLRPVNLVYQVELPSDEVADKVLELAAKAVCDGLLWAEPPLSGQTHPWDITLIQTSAHERGEAHGL